MEATLDECSEVGFQGARLDNIARRCGRNKALIYRYFGNREDLFEAALTFLFEDREQTRAAAPASLGEALAYWWRQTAENPRFMRLIMQEALVDSPDKDPVQEVFRRAYYQRQKDAVVQMQAAGLTPPEMDPTYLFMALTSLISWPSAFPQIVKLISGEHPEDEGFVENWSNFLIQFGELLKSDKNQKSRPELSGFP